MKITTALLLSLSLVVVVACNDDDDDPVTPTTPTSSQLSLNLTNLESLPANERYEGWVIVDGNPVITGLFTVNASGELSQRQFAMPSATLSAATDFVLSIEPYPDNDPAPSDIKILGGSFAGNNAMVSVAHPAALGTDLNSATGTYILATPTTTATSDELSGVWFLQAMSGTAGLSLPALPSNWVYEGWAVINGQPVSTGTFTMASGSDNDAPFSGMDNAGPAFPGEDFIMNAPSGLSFPTDLSGMPIVISIEPNPDNSPMPFTFKPLAANAPANAADHTNYDLTNQAASTFPAGVVTR